MTEETIEETVARSFKELEEKTVAPSPEPVEPEEAAEPEPAPEPAPEKKDEPAPEPEPVVESDPYEKAPHSLSAPIKAKWKELPQEVRAEWARREEDIHKMVTRHDGELQMGREMKEVVAPYMPLITAEGGTPAGAVKDLLNTAYVLRTGSPEQKAQLLREVAKTYGVDIAAVAQEPQQQNPEISALQREIAELKQRANPDYIKSQLQEQFQYDNIQSEVKAFASDPANVYYEQVKPLMASLLATEQAKNLKEAYDLACRAHPTISSTILAQQEQERKSQEKAKLEAKRKASVSPAGSSGVSVPNSNTAKKTPEESVAEAFNRLISQTI